MIHRLSYVGSRLAQLQRVPDRYLTAQKRLEYALKSTTIRSGNRHRVMEYWTRGQKFDAILSRPITVSGPGSRLIAAARRIEEAAELFSDLSSSAESAIQHFWCGNKEFGFRLILASAAGRLASTLLQIASLQGFKLIGACLYAGSAAVSLMALSINKGGLNANNLQRLETTVSVTDQFECSLKKAYLQPINRNGLSPIRRKVGKWIGLSCKRNNLSTLLKHPQQYSNSAAALAIASRYMFKVVNKLGGSWDKHLAFAAAKQTQGQFGLLLSARCALCLGSMASVALGYSLQPLAFSVTTIALMGCATALVFAAGAVVLMSVRGWKGYVPDQVLGKVTPC